MSCSLNATIIFGGLFIPGVFSDHYSILAHISSYNLAHIGLSVKLKRTERAINNTLDRGLNMLGKVSTVNVGRVN